MVAHRKNVPAPRAFVPSTWFIVLSVMLVVGAGGWLGWLLVGDGSSPSKAAAPASSTSKAPVETPVPSKSRVPSKTPRTPAPGSSSEPAPDETRGTSDEPVIRRASQVSVFNNSGVVGAARSFSAKVTGAGWTVVGIGNWTGSIPANTVYYPPNLQSQADLLAADVGISRVRPSVSPMRSDRLTIILSGAQ